jgi:uncharacterized protein
VPIAKIKNTLEVAGMFFHVLMTTNCDLKCRYCYEKSCEDIDADFGDFKVDYSVPAAISYDIGLLKKFCEKDPELALIFYGGEPMLCIDEIRQIMDNVTTKQFVIQTNGLHLNRLEPEYVNRLSTIFVSLDGDEKLTDFYRGRGVYRRVIDNVKLIRRNGFEGEVIARMTVMEETDIYESVRWLLHIPNYIFSSVHWQLDAGFWKNDFSRRPFAKWIEENYNPQLNRLVEFWVNSMDREGKVLRLYPLLGVMYSLLREEESLLRCGSGWANYSIQTDGHIIPCPVMSGMKGYYLGHIQDSHPLQLERVTVEHPCNACEILGECGGRCLYANITKRWSNEAYSLVCKTVRNLVESLRVTLPRVKKLIAEGKIGLSDFDYAKYNSCEVIP